MSREDFIIRVFCLVEEILEIALKDKKLRQRGFEPKLKDGEVMTMEMVGELLGQDTD